MAKIFEIHPLSKGKSAWASYKNEPNSSNLSLMSRNHFLRINLPKEISGHPGPGSSSGSSINTGAILLMVIGISCGLYLSVNGKKSAVANPKRDEQLQTRTAPPPSQPGRPLSKPSSVIAADTARVEGSIMAQRTPDSVPRSQASLAPRYSPMRYEATRKKVFGGCTGQLQLTRSELYFRCPNQVELIFPVAAIAKAHKDGVVLKSGEKYHFTIANHTREQVEAIFISWLDRVQQSPQPGRVSTDGEGKPLPGVGTGRL
jgi:hypothetical protein